MCGSKCFIVEMEMNGTKLTKQVTARNAVGARKVIRGHYGANVRILSAKENTKNR